MVNQPSPWPDVSGIEAQPTTRLYEIWLEKKWGDKIALRAGQLAADTEFINSKYTDVFTNASLGWPAGVWLNLPRPSPPLAAMGARLRADDTDNLTLIGAVFNGNAAGPGPGDPQLRDRYGVNFRVNDPPLALYEAQFQWNSNKGDPGLAGKFKPSLRTITCREGTHDLLTVTSAIFHQRAA
jgi:porin